MIEAVNSVVANAALLRGNTDQSQQDRLNAIVSNPNTERVKMALAPFVSPFIQVNNDYNKAVLQLRDSDTGDVVNQFPSETTMRARAAQAEISSQAQIAEAVAPRNEGAAESAASFARLSPSVRLETEISAGASIGSSGSLPRVAESQIASAALSAGALSASTQTSSVSVFA